VLFLGMNPAGTGGSQCDGEEYGQNPFHRHKVSKRREKKQRAASLTAIDPQTCTKT
jgi:hypothetical protein